MDFRAEIVKLVEAQGIPGALVEMPPDSKLGDYAVPCFTLAKEKKQAPPQIAQELANEITAPFLAEVRATGPYINFFVKPGERAKAVISAVCDTYGKQGKKDDKIMVEYSQPNTHKAFHVGHLRGTSLGESLARILRCAGYDVVQANYSGDTGAHIAKWLWYYTTHDNTQPPKDRHELEKWIANIYVKAVQALEDNPEAQEEVAKILLDLDSNKTGELAETYAKTRQMSIDAFTAIYEDLHAHFDAWFWESEVEQRGKEISRELVKRGIAKEDEGAVIVDLEDESRGIWVLLRKDGTALYSAKDLALAERKFTEFSIDRSIYVVGAAQGMHMQQLFATLKRMAFPQAGKCFHLSFAEVRLPDGKMSSRTGQNILYSDMRKDAGVCAREEVRKRHESWSDEQVEEVVGQVVVAALKWDMLAISPNKNIVFDPKKATMFEGETGPYLQYTFARACGILDKAKGERGDGASLVHEKEQAVLRLLGAFPETVDRAAREYAPSIVAHYSMALAKAFNSFYHDCPVLDAENKGDRLALVQAVVTVLGNGLGLLAIDAPREM